MAEQVQQVGRLAFRVEGANWVAYYAMPDTMEGALVLGSIRMTIVANKVHKAAFMALMQAAVSDILKDVTGQRPDWNTPIAAPEHERAGRA